MSQKGLQSLTDDLQHPVCEGLKSGESSHFLSYNYFLCIGINPKYFQITSHQAGCGAMGPQTSELFTTFLYKSAVSVLKCASFSPVVVQEKLYNKIYPHNMGQKIPINYDLPGFLYVNKC